MPSSTPSAAAEETLATPAAAIEVDTGGASSSNPPPTPEDTEVIFGRWLRSSAEPEAAPVPLPRVLSRAHQALQKTEATILREWEALEAKHQRLSDWRTQLEEHTKAASRQFPSERSELERDHKDYMKDLQKVFARELEVTRKEKRLAKKEVHLD
jgi:predicted RNase H-like nuclease (RuvC/YqgF family)